MTDVKADFERLVKQYHEQLIADATANKRPSILSTVTTEAKSLFGASAMPAASPRPKIVIKELVELDRAYDARARKLIELQMSIDAIAKAINGEKSNFLPYGSPAPSFNPPPITGMKEPANGALSINISDPQATRKEVHGLFSTWGVRNVNIAMVYQTGENSDKFNIATGIFTEGSYSGKQHIETYRDTPRTQKISGRYYDVVIKDAPLQDADATAVISYYMQKMAALTAKRNFDKGPKP